MNKILLFGLVFGLIGTVNAGVGSIDTQCRANGYDYGIVRFEYTCDSPCTYVPEDPPKSPYSVNVTGDDNQAFWVASPVVCGLVHKEATNTFNHTGGTNGTVNKVSHGISHITLCGCNQTTTTTIPETTTTIPETTTTVPETTTTVQETTTTVPETTTTVPETTTTIPSVPEFPSAAVPFAALFAAVGLAVLALKRN